MGPCPLRGVEFVKKNTNTKLAVLYQKTQKTIHFPQTSCKNVKANEISAIQQNVGHSWTTLTVPLFLSGWRGQGSKVLELSGKIMSGW